MCSLPFCTNGLLKQDKHEFITSERIALLLQQQFKHFPRNLQVRITQDNDVAPVQTEQYGQVPSLTTVNYLLCKTHSGFANSRHIYTTTINLDRATSKIMI
jgi:hypothetical protein